MKKKVAVKKLLSYAVLAAMVFSSSAQAYADDEKTKLRINNYVVDFTGDQGVELNDGTYYIPIRKTAERCHFNVVWNDGYALVSKGDNTYKIIPGEDVVYENDTARPLSKPSFILNDRILIAADDAKAMFQLYDDVEVKDNEVNLHNEFKYDDAKFYNLITSFTGDPKTQRGFSWEAEPDYDDMVIQYKKSGDSDDELQEVAPTFEKQPVTWANNVTYDEVPQEIYDAKAPVHISMAAYKLFYKASIGDLTADTEYQYRIGSKSKNVFSDFYSFKTEAENKDSFSIIGVTDPQGRTIEEYDYYKRIIDTSMRDCSNPAFILNCGDFTDNAYFDDWWRFFFEASKGICETIPLMTAIGNHEQRGDGAKYYNYHFNNPQNGIGLANGFVADESTDGFVKPSIENIDNTVYSFDYGNAHFAVVNTGSDWGDATDLLKLQKDWLKNDLSSTNKKWKVLVAHRGIYVEKIRKEAPKEVFLDVIDECGVDLVIEGHDHTYMRTHTMKNDKVADKGTVYALIGSAALKRYDATDIHDWVEVVQPLPADQPNYVRIDFSNEKISFSSKLLNGTEIDNFEIIK